MNEVKGVRYRVQDHPGTAENTGPLADRPGGAPPSALGDFMFFPDPPDLVDPVL
jgi:hypothetical protein